ncbi:hypothetical protein D5S17_05520 [Pseudonocardiaceae bacterium YIM PH 21723]|nr:hypothetical protein D5S17_05520 [Pseudonocardiaceae bacterium YIM PH 21723]
MRAARDVRLGPMSDVLVVRFEGNPAVDLIPPVLAAAFMLVADFPFLLGLPFVVLLAIRPVVLLIRSARKDIALRLDAQGITVASIFRRAVTVPWREVNRIEIFTESHNDSDVRRIDLLRHRKIVLGRVISGWQIDRETLQAALDRTVPWVELDFRD